MTFISITRQGLFWKSIPKLDHYHKYYNFQLEQSESKPDHLPSTVHFHIFFCHLKVDQSRVKSNHLWPLTKWIKVDQIESKQIKVDQTQSPVICNQVDQSESKLVKVDQTQSPLTCNQADQSRSKWIKADQTKSNPMTCDLSKSKLIKSNCLWPVTKWIKADQTQSPVTCDLSRLNQIKPNHLWPVT